MGPYYYSSGGGEAWLEEKQRGQSLAPREAFSLYICFLHCIVFKN